MVDDHVNESEGGVMMAGKKNILGGASAFTVNDNILGLTTIEARRDLSVLTLTLVATTRGFTLAGGGATSSSDAFVVC